MSYHEELAAHLASQAHPKQGTGLTADGQRLVRPPTQIVPDPLEQQMSEMRARMDKRQRELDKIMGTFVEEEPDDIPAINVRGLLLGASALIIIGLGFLAWRFV